MRQHEFLVRGRGVTAQHPVREVDALGVGTDDLRPGADLIAQQQLCAISDVVGHEDASTGVAAVSGAETYGFAWEVGRGVEHQDVAG